MRVHIIKKSICFILSITLLFMLLSPIPSVSAASITTPNEWFEDFEGFPLSTAFGTSGNGDTQFGWKSNAGTNPWSVAQDGSSKTLKVTNPGTSTTTVFVGGTGQYVFDATDVLVSADVRIVTTGSVPSPTGQIGINARQASNNDYYSLVIKGTNLQLLKRNSGTSTVLLQKPIPNFTYNKYYTLTLLVKGSQLIGSISGGPTITTTDTSITTASTKVGVNATTTMEANIDNFHAMKVFPNSPTGLTSVSAVDNQVNLQWSGAVGSEQYTVLRGTASGGPYTTIATVTDGVYSDNNVMNGTQYYYIVSSVAKAGNGSYISGAISPEYAVKPIASTQAPAAAPAQFHVAPGDGVAILSWDPVNQVTGYKIKRSMVSGGPYNTVVSSVYPTTTTYTDTTVTFGTTYYYVISPFNGSGESINSSEGSVYIASALDAPSNLTAIPGYNSAKLQWTPVEGAASYVVKRANTSNGAYSVIASNIEGTSFTDTSIQNGTTYFYVVQDVNAGNVHSANSNEAQATPQMKYDLGDTQITASSYDGVRDQDPASGNKPIYVKDDLTTRWGADGKGQWIQFDLNTISNLGFIGISFYKGDERSYSFQVQTSKDAAAWNTIYTGISSGSTKQMENFDVPDTDARYVRIVGFGNSATNYNGYTVVHLYSSNPNGMVNAPYSQGTPVIPSAAARPPKAGLYNPDGSDHQLPAPNAVTGRTLNVKDPAYGAKGDGDTDDRAAIQKAVDDAQSGDEVYLPNGVYKLLSAHPSDANSHIRLKTGVNLRGESREGTVLLSDMDNGFGPLNGAGHVTSTGITAGSGRVLLISSLNNIIVSNLTITATWSNTYSTDPTILSPTSGGPKTGIYIDQANASSPGPSNIVVDNVIFEKFQQMGIRLSKASDVTVKNSIFRKATDVGPSGSGYGISIQGKPKDDHFGKNDDSLYTLVENNIFDGSDALRHGIIVQYYSHNNVVRNNQFIQTTLDSIDLHGENEYLNEVYDNTIVGARRGAGVGLGNTGGGFPSNHSESGPFNYIHDNIIKNSAGGISLTMGSPDTIIENNTIELDENLTRNSYNQDIEGITVLNAPRTIIRGNVIRNFGETDYPIVTDYDLGDTNANYVGAGDPRDVQIIGNTIIGNANGIKIVKGSGMVMQDNELNNSVSNVDNASGNVIYDVILHPSQDAWVEAANPEKNYADSNNLVVKSSANGNIGSMAYLTYDLSDQTRLATASLQLSGKLSDSNPGDEAVTLSVYGLLDSSWTEDTVNWTNSTNHNGTEVTGVGQTATYLGNFTMKGYKADSYNVATKELADYVKSKAGSMATFMIVDANKQGMNVELYSRENDFESLRPALKLFPMISTNADLSSLTVSAGVLSPAFSAGITSYMVNVANDVTSMNVTPTTAEAGAKLEVNNTTSVSGAAYGVNLSIGANLVKIDVTAQSGVKKTYVITINRDTAPTELSNNADLSSLTVSAGALSPAFSAGVTSYAITVTNGVSSINVTPTAADAKASLKVNGTSTVSGATYGQSLFVGNNTISIDVTAENGAKKTYQIGVLRSSSSRSHSGGSSGGGGGTSLPSTPTDTNSTPSNQAAVLKAVVTSVNGKSVAQAQADAHTISDALNNNSNGRIQLTVDSSAKADQTMVTLSNSALQKIGTETGVQSVIVGSSYGSYELPAMLMNLQELASQLGVSQDKISMEVTITKNTAAANPVKGSGQKVLGALEFTVKIISADGKSIELSNFTRYVPRTIKADGTLSGKRLAAVRIETDSQGNPVYQPVPFHVSGNEAILYSRSNSTYLLLENNVTFSDITDHWAKADIETMASKMVVQGITQDEFQPDQAVTRAQFAALIARTLGLKSVDSPRNRLTDVDSGDWFAGQVYAAAEAGIVSGYEDQSFRPNHSISRQEMAVMIYRAMQFAGFNSSTSIETVSFSDENQLEGWAKESIAALAAMKIVEGGNSGAFEPSATATRAQSAVILSRMLSKLQFTK